MLIPALSTAQGEKGVVQTMTSINDDSLHRYVRSHESLEGGGMRSASHPCYMCATQSLPPHADMKKGHAYSMWGVRRKNALPRPYTLTAGHTWAC